MELVQNLPEHITLAMLECLGPITILDKVLRDYGADAERAPADYSGDWPDHLAWGVDSAVAAVRLMLCGQFVGAAAIARNQMERWLMHRAHNAGVSQQPGESTLDFVARVWSQPDHFSEHWFEEGTGLDPAFADDDVTSAEEPGPPHDHVQLTDGTEICPAVLYGLLSEIMHGRMLVDAVRWESHGLLDGADPPGALIAAVRVTADTLSLCLRQIRLAALTLAVERGDHVTAAYLDMPVDRFSRTDRDPADENLPLNPPSDSSATSSPKVAAPPMVLLAPLQPYEGLQPSHTAAALEMSDAFEAVMSGKRPAGRLFRDDEMTTVAFAWHRGRSIKASLRALDAEREHFGDEFDSGTLSIRTMRWGVLSEASGVVGEWVTTPEHSAALAVIGSGTRSAYWMWLEDDDRAMAILRCVLEQAARSKTWRTKPVKAARLEARDQTTPRDWIEAAGWRRLTPLNTALGEFAHVKATSRWSGARTLLSHFQRDADPDVAAFTARGAALEFVVMLAAMEVAEAATTVSESIGSALVDAFTELGLVPDRATSRTVEEQFDHVWAQRMTGLGSPVFSKPRAAEGSEAQV